MTVKEFAKRAEISLSLAYALIAEGRVPHRGIGQAAANAGQSEFREMDFEQFMETVKAVTTD